MGQDNPFSHQPATAFWRTGVAEPGLYRYENLWHSGFSLPANVQFATYGSCFAQHIHKFFRCLGHHEEYQVRVY